MNGLLVSAIVLIACVAPLEAELPMGWREAGADVLVHVDSNLGLSPTLVGLRRRPPVTFDEHGFNVAISYVDSKGLTVSLFIYRDEFSSRADLGQEFKGALQAALSVLPSHAQHRRRLLSALPLGEAMVIGNCAANGGKHDLDKGEWPC